MDGNSHCTADIDNSEDKYAWALKSGFIPSGEVPAISQPSDMNLNFAHLPETVKNPGKLNFMGVQITIKSQLNPNRWDDLLQGYWDTQLPLLVRYSFPLDFNRSCILETHTENLSSAKNFPHDVQAYLDENVQHSAIHGPFKNPPISNLHTSPLMTREKPNALHRRVIVDLSFPFNKSINAGTNKDVYIDTPYQLTLPKIDLITDQVKKLGKGCCLYKVDISRAFRHVKIDPHDYDLLGQILSWE